MREVDRDLPGAVGVVAGVAVATGAGASGVWVVGDGVILRENAADAELAGDAE